MKLITAKVAVIEAGRALCMSGSSGNPDAQLWGLEKGSVVGVCSATKPRNLVRSLVEERTNSSNMFSDFYMCANTFSLSPPSFFLSKNIIKITF